MNSSFNPPLSWKISGKNDPEITRVKLNLRTDWLALAEFPPKINLSEWLNSEDKNKKCLLIRGCGEELSDALTCSGYERISVGMEAVLEFGGNHFNKKSLRSLIKRGKRFGETAELEFNNMNIEKLQNFKRLTAHGSSPQLKNLFRDEFAENSRLFVFRSVESEWLGAVLVSDNSKYKYHTELILRLSGAPVGVMEALIYDVFTALSNTGRLEFSLGEVPFISANQGQSFFSKSKLIRLSGRLLKFAYNYKGLYAFKNKFQPRWEKIYLCGKPHIRLSDLFSMAIKSNLIALSLFKAGEIVSEFLIKI